MDPVRYEAYRQTVLRALADDGEFGVVKRLDNKSDPVLSLLCVITNDELRMRYTDEASD